MPAHKLWYLLASLSLVISSTAGCQTAPTGSTRGSGADGEVEFQSGTSLNESIRGVLIAPDATSPVVR